MCTVPFLRGKEIRRYQPVITNARLISPYEISSQGCRLLSQSEMETKYPLTFNYLQANKAALATREKGKFKGPNWYAFGYPKSMHLFQKPKIIIPDYNNVASFTFDSEAHFYKTGYGIIPSTEEISPMYLLGLLNSRLLFTYLLSIATTLRGGYVRFWRQFIEPLPIRTINFSDPDDKARHDQMVQLVQRMLDLHKNLAAANSPHDQELLKREITATDSQIDSLVYELYSLTPAEIAIVEKREA
jgi:hypothetical protein